jgi:hypothetical protein
LLFCADPSSRRSPSNDTQLKQVIIFGRHGARTPILPNTVAGPGLALDSFSALPFPAFQVSGVAILTPNGAANETIFAKRTLFAEGEILRFDAYLTRCLWRAWSLIR